MRVLLTAAGGEGHLGPLLPFAAAARASGDDVLVVVPPEQEATVRAAGLRYRLSDAVPPAVVRRIRSAMAVGTAADRSRLAEVDLFGRACTDAALPTIEAVAERFRPDLILREPCDYAAAVVAHRRGVPMAQVAISPGRADWNGLHLAADVVEPIDPGVVAAIEAAPYLSRFPDLDSGYPDTRAYGPPLGTRTRQPETPPLVLVTFGTVDSAFEALEDTWRTVFAAMAGLPLRGVASTGRGVALQAVPPAGTRVVEWVDPVEVLATASAVVCHGGSGTTSAALAAGVPLLVIPLIADQPANAALVEALGAGIVIRAEEGEGGALRGLGAADVPRVRAALRRLLDDDSYALAAQRVRRRLGARAAVPAVLHGLRRSAPHRRGG